MLSQSSTFSLVHSPPLDRTTMSTRLIAMRIEPSMTSRIRGSGWHVRARHSGSQEAQHWGSQEARPKCRSDLADCTSERNLAKLNKRARTMNVKLHTSAALVFSIAEPRPNDIDSRTMYSMTVISDLRILRKRVLPPGNESAFKQRR